MSDSLPEARSEAIRPDEILDTAAVRLRPEGEVRATRSEARLRVRTDVRYVRPPGSFLGAALDEVAREMWEAVQDAEHPDS